MLLSAFDSGKKKEDTNCSGKAEVYGFERVGLR